MKKFQFPLETLLKVRTQRIKIFGHELFETAKACHALRQQEEEISEMLLQAEREMIQKREKGELNDQGLHHNYLEHLKSRVEEVKNEKERKQKELIQTQEKTSKAIQERKIVEKLKEKKYTLWEIEREKEESRATTEQRFTK